MMMTDDNLNVTILTGHQHTEIVTVSFRLQHLSPTSTYPIEHIKITPSCSVKLEPLSKTRFSMEGYKEMAEL